MINTITQNGVTGSVAITAGTAKFYQFGNVLSSSPTPVTSYDYTVDTMVQFPTILSNLTARVDAAPGANKTVIFTLFVNGVATAVTCTISGASAVRAQDTTHTVFLNAGDSYCMKIDPLAAGSSTKAVFGIWQRITDKDNL